MKKRRHSKINIILYLLSALLLIAGVILIVKQYVYIPMGDYVPPPTPSPTPVFTPAPTDPLHTNAPTPSPTPYVKHIPTRIWFTERKIDCEIQPVGRIDSGELAGKMDTVNSATIAAWYQDGPSPGEPGNSLINGHVRWKGTAGTFSILPNMKIGEEVVIGFDDNSTLVFEVFSVEIYPKDDYPENIMGNHEDTRVTLITCHGDFDHDAGTSKDRCFVVLVPKQEVSSTPTAQ